MRRTRGAVQRAPNDVVARTKKLDQLGVAELVVRLRDGEEAAWVEVVRRFTPLVKQRIRALGLSFNEMEDAFQQTWVKLAQSIDSLRNPERLAGWLSVTARNEAVNVIRRNERLVPVDQIEEYQYPDDGNVDAGLLSDDAVDAVAAAMAKLPSRQRSLVQLRYLDEREPNYEEISGSLQVAKGAIGPTLGRALNAMGTHPSIMALADRA